MRLPDEFLLERAARGHQGRGRQILQYCPCCLEADKEPYFRRAWRFGVVAVCIEHACRLHDRCWHCEALIEPLQQRDVHPRPRCAHCDARFSKAGKIDASRFRPKQSMLLNLLFYLESQIDIEEQATHYEALLRAFYGIPNGSVEIRLKSLGELRTCDFERWFGMPRQTMHMVPLRMLAEGVHYSRLAVIRRSRERREKCRAIVDAVHAEMAEQLARRCLAKKMKPEGDRS